MTQTTPRLALPMLAPGQAQKEMSHNEALLLLDLLAQPVVETVGLAVPPDTPLDGQAWIVGTSGSGAWQGRDRSIALWSAGGWRFVVPVIGMALWVRARQATARWSGTDWVVGTLSGDKVVIGGNQILGAQAAAISSPAGGSVSDAECRQAVSAILAVLRTHGLIAR